MQEPGRYSGTIQYVYVHWPQFALLYGGMVAALLFVGVSMEMGLMGFVPLATAVMLLLAYFFLALLWRGYQLYDQQGLSPHMVLFEMGTLTPESDLVYVDIGLRQRPISLSRRLTIGHITVVDIYNPQWLPARTLARQRARWQHPMPDPRLSWREGEINLLPLPDGAVTVVMLCHITSELWQHGDRLALLQEAYRILEPGGRLLFAEPYRTEMAWLISGPAALQLPTAVYWRKLLTEAGFRIRQEQSLNGLIYCLRAHKPTPAEAQQLMFDLKY